MNSIARSQESTSGARPAAHVGVLGGGVMGANLVRNICEKLCVEVPVFDASPERRRVLADSYGATGLYSVASVEDLVAHIRPNESRRVILLFVPPGAPVDDAISDLAPHLTKGDIVVDCGNSNFEDTSRRLRDHAEAGFTLVGAGVSGGEEGALRGPSMMVGGSPDDWAVLQPLFEAISSTTEDGISSAQHVGSGAAGHFVKMVHNGIEYADMALISEAYGLLSSQKLGPGLISNVFHSWNDSEPSYLLASAARVLQERDEFDPRRHLIEVVSDEARNKGTGSWAVSAAAGLGVDVGTLAQAFFSRTTSSNTWAREAMRAASAPPALSARFYPAQIEQTYRLARLVVFQQGLDLLYAGSRAHSWDVDIENVLTSWQSGSILSGELIVKLREMAGADTGVPLIMAAPGVRKTVEEGIPSLRTIVSGAAASGCPVPTLAAALSFMEMLSATRLHTALVQLQRDYFGAHTYERTDRPGTFHTAWRGMSD